MQHLLRTLSGVAAAIVLHATAAIGQETDTVRDRIPESVRPIFDECNEKCQASDVPGALRRFEDAVRQEPQSYPVRIIADQLALYADRPKDAIRHATAALELDPGSENGYVARGVARSKEDDHAGAEEDLSRAIEVNPGNLNNRLLRAVVRFQLAKPKEALDDVFWARLNDSRPETIEFCVQLLLANKRFRDANGEATHLVRRYPEYVRGHLIRGEVLTALDRDEEADAAFAKAVVLDEGTLSSIGEIRDRVRVMKAETLAKTSPPVPELPTGHIEDYTHKRSATGITTRIDPGTGLPVVIIPIVLSKDTLSTDSSTPASK